MFSKNKPENPVDLEQHKLLEYAQKRVRQKKRLFSHFVIFLIGSVFLVLINKILKYGEAYDWFIWGILLWSFLFLIHAFNVFVTHKFMGQNWERKQREKLVAKQKNRIAAIQKEIETDFPISKVNKKRSVKQLIIIAAASENNALGKDNDLPWHLPDDFKRFKALTSGHKVIMGRKTLESFPKALPNRDHIAITRDKDYRPKFPCKIVHSLESAVELVGVDEKAFIIGGGEIYRQAISLATSIELTRIHATVEADTFFPEIDEEQWKLVNEEFHPSDERHPYSFTYQTYTRP